MSQHDEARAPHPATLRREMRVDREGLCGVLAQAVDSFVRDQCRTKHNHLDHCTEEGAARCPCADSGRVDLVILIDGSGSMYHPAQAVSATAPAAIKQALAECPTDLRVTWLVVDNAKPGTSPVGTGTWTGTQFTQTHEQYLVLHGAPGPFYHNAPAGGTGNPNEQGADAVADVARFFDWRPGACRAIFYISDTTLDSGGTQDPGDTAATATAIAVAQINQVAVFAHFVTPHQTNNPTATKQDYQNLCTQTGGTLYDGAVSQATYVELLKGAICNACRRRCVEAPLPDLQPCISVSWGESDCDCLETDDTEVLCITVCNCYSNVTLLGLTISYLWLTDAAGNWVETLPDGTPAVQIHPVGPICFGDIPPCTAEGATCVSREVVLTSRGARSGDYQLEVGGVCFGIGVNYITDDCFKLKLCAD